jgi:hypothetical protein
MHYAFVSWLQFAILGLAMPAFAKGVSVFAVALLLSWGESAALRSILAVAGSCSGKPREIPKRSFR